MQLKAGALLPDVSLPSAAPEGAPFPLRGGRGPRAVVALHGGDCAGCREYVRGLAAAVGAAAEWGGRLIVVWLEGGPGPRPALPAPAGGLVLVRDPDAAVVGSAPVAVVADEWGEVYFASEGTGAAWGGGGVEPSGAHGLPEPAELVEWIRFAAIQCPECEGPEGEWRTA